MSDKGGMAHDRLKVLLVDDDSAFLKVTQKILEQNHCIVRTANSQEAALSVVLNEIVHLAFIDCVLLCSEGTELVRKIRELLGNSVEMALVSGIVSKSSVENCLQKESCSFLKKPLKPSDIERTVNETKAKTLQQASDNILIRHFGPERGAERKLKQLFSLSKTDDLRFFLSLSGLFGIEGSFSVGFHRPAKPRNVLFIKNGAVVDYTTEDRESFWNILRENHILTEKEKAILSGRNMSQNIRILLAKGFISPHRITDIKTKLLFQDLKSLKGEKEIQVFVDFSKAETEWLSIPQNDFGDEVFSFLKDGPFTKFQELAERDLTGEALIKQTQPPSRLSSIKVPEGLKEGMRFSEMKAEGDSPEKFYAEFFYLFLQGGILVTENSFNKQYEYLKERYVKLEELFKNKKPREIFQLLSGLSGKEMSDEGQVIKTHRNFMNFNHIDKMPSGLPKHITVSVNSASFQINERRLELTSKETSQKKSKEEINQKALKMIETHKKQKMCQELLEKENYMEGFKVLSSLSDEIMSGELKCKLLYLWIAFQKPAVGTTEDKKSKFFHEINIAPPAERKSCLYLFILGLFYASQKKEDKAIKYFKNCQTYDPAFKPAHKALRGVLLNKARQKTERRKTKGGAKLSDTIKNRGWRKSG